MSSGFEWQAASDAVAACDRLAPKLRELAEQHAHAANQARADWTGPHHASFEDRFAAAQRALDAGMTWVSQVRQGAAARLAQLTAEAEEAARVSPSTGPR
jgi:hypothetical protein